MTCGIRVLPKRTRVIWGKLGLQNDTNSSETT